MQAGYKIQETEYTEYIRKYSEFIIQDTGCKILFGVWVTGYNTQST